MSGIWLSVVLFLVRDYRDWLGGISSGRGGACRSRACRSGAGRHGAGRRGTTWRCCTTTAGNCELAAVQLDGDLVLCDARQVEADHGGAVGRVRRVRGSDGARGAGAARPRRATGRGLVCAGVGAGVGHAALSVEQLQEQRVRVHEAVERVRKRVRERVRERVRQRVRKKRRRPCGDERQNHLEQSGGREVVDEVVGEVVGVCVDVYVCGGMGSGRRWAV